MFKKLILASSLNFKRLVSSPLGGQNASGPPSYTQVGPPGSDFRDPGAQKKNFQVQKPQKLIILGLLKFAKNSPTLSLWGVQGRGPYRDPLGLYRRPDYFVLRL